VLNLIANVKPS
jgi:hypothetical protein